MSSGNTDKSPSPGKCGKPTNAPNHSATYLRKKQTGKSINIIPKIYAYTMANCHKMLGLFPSLQSAKIKGLG